MAHSMDSRETLLETIQSLQEMARRSTNEHEAAAAAGQVTRLLMKHDLTLEEVNAHQTTSDPLVEEEKEFRGANGQPTSRTPTWKNSLMFAVARACLCAAFYTSGDYTTRRKKASYTILGRKTHVDVAIYLYTYLERTLEELGEERFQQPDVNGLRWRNSWYLGAVEAVSVRLKEERKAFEEASDTCRALVQNKMQEAKAWMHQHHKLSRSSGSGPEIDSGAYSDGNAAGHSLQIRQGMNYSPAGYKLLGN